MPIGILRISTDLDNLRLSIQSGQIKEIEIVPAQGDTDLKKTFAIAGPIDSPYEGYWFRVSIDFGKNFPFHPPTVKMIDNIWSPYFDQNTGEICIDILYTEWSASYTANKLLLSITSLLSQNEIDLEQSSFLNPQAVILMKKNHLHFAEQASKFCQNNHYKKSQIYNDTQREVPRQRVIEAQGEALQNILETEKQEETLKKRKLIYKEKMSEQKKKIYKESDDEQPIP